jgi:hypothetical protein
MTTSFNGGGSRREPPTKQAVIERRKVECPTYSTATDDIKIMNNHIPLPLAS